MTRPVRNQQRSSVQIKSHLNLKTEITAIFDLNTTTLFLALLHSIPATVTINIPPLTKYETNRGPSRLLQIEYYFGEDVEKGVREDVCLFIYFFICFQVITST